MFPRKNIFATLLLLAILSAVVSTGCGPTPPLKYTELQVGDMTQAEGWDVYEYIYVDRGITQSELETLLVWFYEVKYIEVKKIKILVWDNPQAARLGDSNDLMAELSVDRDEEVYDIVFYLE